jgi:hypothetical protein
MANTPARKGNETLNKQGGERERYVGKKPGQKSSANKEYKKGVGCL